MSKWKSFNLKLWFQFFLVQHLNLKTVLGHFMKCNSEWTLKDTDYFSTQSNEEPLPNSWPTENRPLSVSLLLKKNEELPWKFSNYVVIFF